MRKITSIITVLLLATCLLAGCGQNSSKDYEKDSGAAGSESSATTESSDPTADESSSSSTSEVKKDADGKYVYYIGTTECKSSININDYIYTDGGQQYIDVAQMMIDAGWTPSPNNYNAQNGKWKGDLVATYNNGSDEMKTNVGTNLQTKNSLGKEQKSYMNFVVNGSVVSSVGQVVPEIAIYAIKGESFCAISYSQIVYLAAGLENVKAGNYQFVDMTDWQVTGGDSHSLPY